MTKKRIGMIGFGTVGTAFYEQIISSKKWSEELEFVAILVSSKNKERKYPVSDILYDAVDDFLKQTFDYLIEVSSGLEPSYQCITHCLKNQIPVVSANKKVIAFYFNEFISLSRKFNTPFLFESSTLAGMPVQTILRDLANSDEIDSIEGIFNGSTNYCLTRCFRDGLQMDQAIVEAKQLGYLESDPSDDLDGFDSTNKLRILASLSFQKNITLKTIHRYPLSKITKTMIDYLKDNGYLLKYWCKANSQVIEVIPLACKGYPYEFISDELNLIQYTTKYRGVTTVIGSGAGGNTTASGLIADLSKIMNHDQIFYPILSEYHPANSSEEATYLIETDQGIKFYHSKQTQMEDPTLSQARCYVKVNENAKEKR